MTTRLRHLPVGLAASGVLLVVAALTGWLTRGGAAAAGAAAGIALVVVSYVISSVSVAWADSVNPRLVLPVGLGTYAVKFILLGFVLVAVSGTGWAGTTAMGLAIIPGVAVWVGTQVWWALRRGVPYVQVKPQ
jgi:hypothetical protein